MPDLIEPEIDYLTQPGRSKVFVNDGIPPIVQRLQIGPPADRVGVVFVQRGPEVDTETPEVGSETAGLGVPPIELTTTGQFV